MATPPTTYRPNWAQTIRSSLNPIPKPRLSIEIANGAASVTHDKCVAYASYDSFEHVVWVAMHYFRSSGESLMWWKLETFKKLVKNDSDKWLQPKKELLTDGVLDTQKIIDAWEEAVTGPQRPGG